MSLQYLFVYGTLRSDTGSIWHERLIAPFFSLAGTGSASGTLYSLGEYPGLVEHQGDVPRVSGEVYQFDPATTTLAELDLYEGCDPLTPHPQEYRRVQTCVQMDNGAVVKAWCYYFLGDVSGLEPIDSWAG